MHRFLEPAFARLGQQFELGFVCLYRHGYSFKSDPDGLIHGRKDLCYGYAALLQDASDATPDHIAMPGSLTMLPNLAHSDFNPEPAPVCRRSRWHSALGPFPDF